MHPIKRIFLIGLFGFGTVAGFAHGFAHLGHCRAERRDAWEEHVADVCTRSAERVWQERAASAPASVTPTITISAPATVTVGTAAPTVAPAPIAAPVASPTP